MRQACILKTESLACQVVASTRCLSLPPSRGQRSRVGPALLQGRAAPSWALQNTRQRGVVDQHNRSWGVGSSLRTDVKWRRRYWSWVSRVCAPMPVQGPLAGTVGRRSAR